MAARHERGIVFDIKRFAIHDGPGIRTTVFLKGCPLACAWCHNPEGIAAAPQIAYDAHTCIGCARCAAVCPGGCHSVSGAGHLYERSRCTSCGRCAEACPTEALRLIGREMSTAEVLDVVLRDRAFYATSGGGITVSGGEPLAQPQFARAVLAAARADGLHTCLDTSGFVLWEHLESVLPLVDLFLWDVKDTDAARHRANTGVDLELILDNLRRLDRAGANLMLRCPMVPGVNDSEEDAGALADLWYSLESRPPVELLPYHRMGEGKRATIGEAPGQPFHRRAESGTVRRPADLMRHLGVVQVEVNEL